MKQLIIFGFALLLICSSCQTKEVVSNDVSITGQIENHDQSVLKFQDFMGKGKRYTEIVVQDGTFAINLPINKPVIKMLTFGSTFKNIFLQPGETLDISFDALKIDSTFKFGGSLASENVLLDSISGKLKKVDYNYIYNESLENAGKYLDSMSAANKQYIEALIVDQPLSTHFEEYAKAMAEYNNSALKIMLGERQDEQPNNYYDFINQLSLENDDYLDIWEYRFFLSYYVEMKANKRIQPDSVKIAEPDALFDESLSVIKELKNENIRDYALFNALNMRLSEKGLVGFENYYTYFKEHNKDPHYAEQLKLLYEEKQLLAPGQPAPAFTLEDVDGNLVSLNDFKGKYVYIDFWQTLCPRSARELPYLLNLHSDYQDDNIEFVSISVNEDENVWRDYVKEHKNMGTSLRVTQSWDSKTYTDYQANGLPAFILIDTEGNIIDPKAAKPSSKEIREIFDELLKSK
ncbi:AhpC/TSA family protein [Paucihalobacter ruber]|uniref:AhpC/TSA family protein n=1 Tax=Paucihalobacter ruber TaxID=2567861 RepID=A0A506PN96_9FLAO|nr:TlpA disulfide reductase family protein [Paucihalobacter ruber]TPV35366.1 AhpC/TSA family protein [Paucihalobacter ruber]